MKLTQPKSLSTLVSSFVVKICQEMLSTDFRSIIESLEVGMPAGPREEFGWMELGITAVTDWRAGDDEMTVFLSCSNWSNWYWNSH